jgi:flagellar biosynthesis GTPase FlhF
MRTTLLSSLFVVALVGGCTATGSARYSATATTPRLVYVSSDVQVIEDYHEPIFYSGNFYWRYDNGVWYRSTYHTRDWVRVTVVPVSIRRIERPSMYIRYHASARGNAQPGPVVRDHRDDDRREMKQEAKEERKEVQQERKEAQQERKEVQQEAKEERKEERKEAQQERKEAQHEAKEQRKDDKHDAKHDRKNKK